MTVAELAARLGGALAGDGAAEITGLASLADAGAGDLSFLANPKYAADMPGTRAAAVIVAAAWTGACGAPLIRVAHADRAFAQAAVWLAPPPPRYPTGVHPGAFVAAAATLAPDVSIGPACVIEPGAAIGARTVLVAGCYIGHGARIGEDCVLHAHVSVREGCIVGARVIIHNGSVIGSDGFGYTPQGEAWVKIPQVGIVEIGDDVEIGANATVDRARFGRTVIARGTKIDNLVQVAHNVRIGEHTAIAAQVGIAGSTRIGRCVQLGGQAGLAGHLEVGDHASVGAQAGVTKNVPAGVYVTGYPAMPHQEAAQAHAHLMRMPALKAKITDLEARIKDLEACCERMKEERQP
jgi:UDP-3-O-[3-hydroxymyristoyl] glucosamine N-acyltransferase